MHHHHAGDSAVPPSSSPGGHHSGPPQNDDNDDNLSTISGMSDLSGADWKPDAGPISWVHAQMSKGSDPRQLLQVHSYDILTFIHF